jgi:hypothetical protein
VAVVIEHQQRQQARDAAVAVAEGMDAHEVQHERGNQHEVRRARLGHGVAIRQRQLLDRARRLRDSHGTEAHDKRRADTQLDDVVVHALPLARIARRSLCKRVKTAGRVRRHREVGSLGVDQRQRVAVTADILLGAIPRLRAADDQRPQAIGGDGDALDAVRRLCALDESRLAQRAQELRSLTREELLPALALGDVAQEPARRRRASHS